MANATDDRLLLLIERIERLEEEKKGIQDDIKDVYAEAKAVGYDTKITRQIVRLRKMNPESRREMEALLETYKCAVGLEQGSLFDDEAVPFRSARALAEGATEPSGEQAAAEGGATPQPAVSIDPRFIAALRLVTDHGKASTSWLQRQLGIGYNSAAELVDRMAAHKIIGPCDHVGRRAVLAVDFDDAMARAGIISPAPDVAPSAQEAA